MEKLQVLICFGFMTQLTRGIPEDGYYNWLQIDCGVISNETLKELNITTWRLDDEFIKTGQNMLLSMNLTPPQMISLRFFSKGNKNCYELPLRTPATSYLLRAGFYYGNYDNLSKPPTFDLQFDGNQWATVVTSLSEEAIFHEIYYTPIRIKVQVCLVRRNTDGGGDAGVPFISSLEATHTPFNSDSIISQNKTAFYLQSRNRFGSNQQVGGLYAPGVDIGNRIWKPKSTPSYTNLVPSHYVNTTSYGTEYYPPFPVISFAIQASNHSSPITMSVDFSSRVPLSAFFVFYFAKVFIQPPLNNGRGVRVFIDGHDKGVAYISDTYGNVSVLKVYPVVVVGSANVTISAVENTTLPALINAMEVYTAIEVQVSQGGTVALNCLRFVFITLCPLIGNLIVLFWLN